MKELNERMFPKEVALYSFKSRFAGRIIRKVTLKENFELNRAVAGWISFLILFDLTKARKEKSTPLEEG